MKPAACVCVDWGTTRCRLWAFDGDGRLLAERQNERGAATLNPAEYEAALEAALSERGEWGESGVAPDTPVVICGMAGARGGWSEAPYLDPPVQLATLAQAAVRVAAARRDVRILPGVAQRDARAPDVMRGEETLLLGAALRGAIRGVVCLPGTHSKWAQVETGVLRRFDTAMTGEVFALLADHSTLAPFVSSAQTAFAGSPSFSAAVREAIDAPERILQSLFSVRAQGVLMKDEANANANRLRARLSGLLIGLEIAAIKPITEQRHPITLISEGALATNYHHALTTAGIETHCHDAHKLARTGLYHAAQSLHPNALRKRDWRTSPARKPGACASV